MIKLALLCLFALPLSAAQDGGARPRQDWIASDVKRIEQFRAAIHAKPLDVESLVERFGSIDAHDDVDAGFGVRRVRMHLYGGYTTIWIDILAEKGTAGKKSRIAELRAQQIGPAEWWTMLGPEFAKAWGESAQPIERGFQFTFREDELARTLRTRTAEALGGEVRVTVPKELHDAFDLLASPFEAVVIGSSFGYSGGPPPGRVEIEALAKAGRYDLVQAVLRGVNPEGRLYAAWALRRRTDAPLAPADARAIDALLALPAEVQTSSGCERMWRSPKDALQSLSGDK